jgi:hypothetical protein
MPSPARNACIGAVRALPAQKKKPPSRKCTDWSANYCCSVASRRYAALQKHLRLQEGNPDRDEEAGQKKADRLDGLLKYGVACEPHRNRHSNIESVELTTTAHSQAATFNPTIEPMQRMAETTAAGSILRSRETK